MKRSLTEWVAIGIAILGAVLGAYMKIDQRADDQQNTITSIETQQAEQMKALSMEFEWMQQQIDDLKRGSK